ncbi:MAG TPA: hypothetical protein VII98_08060 [Solirubrobacteraceae bacterium]
MTSEATADVVGQAADGEEAVEQAVATGADVVLMDLRMRSARPRACWC